MEEDFSDEDSAAIERLQTHVDRLTGNACRDCGARLCGHQALFVLALGAQDQPRCWRCLASSLGFQATNHRSAEWFRDDLAKHFRHRVCYGTVWDRVSQREARREDGLPVCMWSLGESVGHVGTEAELDRPTENELPEQSRPEVVWDAGELACGELLLQLRLRLRDLAPATRFRLTAQDRGAVEDIPAWCRLTGHRLLHALHPHYLLERKST